MALRPYDITLSNLWTERTGYVEREDLISGFNKLTTEPWLASFELYLTPALPEERRDLSPPYWGDLFTVTVFSKTFIANHKLRDQFDEAQLSKGLALDRADYLEVCDYVNSVVAGYNGPYLSKDRGPKTGQKIESYFGKYFELFY